jgi:hypothetical protein
MKDKLKTIFENASGAWVVLALGLAFGLVLAGCGGGSPKALAKESAKLAEAVQDAGSNTAKLASLAKKVAKLEAKVAKLSGKKVEAYAEAYAEEMGLDVNSVLKSLSSGGGSDKKTDIKNDKTVQAAIKAIQKGDAKALAKMTQGKQASPAGDFTYDLNKAGDGIVIRKYTGTGGAVIVPEKIENIPVVEIGESAFGTMNFWGTPDEKSNSIFAVVLPSTVTKIGKEAFCGCANLSSINFPAALKEISRYAFSGSGITEAKIPEGITTINAGTFGGCKKLTSVTLPASLTTIASLDPTFGNCTELLDIVIPASITAIKWVREESLGLDKGYKFVEEDDTSSFRGDGKLKLAVRQRLKDLGYKGEF